MAAKCHVQKFACGQIISRHVACPSDVSSGYQLFSKVNVGVTGRYAVLALLSGQSLKQADPHAGPRF